MPEHGNKSILNSNLQPLDRKEAIHHMNMHGQAGTPFFFLVSYDQKRTILVADPLNSQRSDVLFTFPDYTNHPPILEGFIFPDLDFKPPFKNGYAQQYKTIQKEFHNGNIYLLNLTHSTPIQSKASMEDIYHQAKAKYKVFLPDQFVVFSPETFVRIRKGKIFTHPMKGTIRADRPKALQKLRDNPKEQAEHASVVDLLRNDIGQVAKTVRVNRYRYFEKVQAGLHKLWQASSEIEGTLHSNFSSYLGDLIFTLLPAGSITGVPKKNAVSIIDQVEEHERGYYTGICGYFDGQNLDSGVMIRFIERTTDGLVYKSGGGIHFLGKMENEYQELIEKIYVPVD